MHNIFRRPNITAAIVASVLTGACSSENPASMAEAPSAPRLDGGATVGSGSATQGTENTETATDTGSTARGGLFFGSGR